MKGYFLMDDRQLSRVDAENCYSIENMERHIGMHENVTYMGTRIAAYKTTEDRTLFDYYKGQETGRWWYRTRTMKPDETIIDIMEELDRMIKESKERRRRKYEFEQFGNIQELERGEESGESDRNSVGAECMQ